MAVGVGVAEAQHVLGPDDARVGEEIVEVHAFTVIPGERSETRDAHRKEPRRIGRSRSSLRYGRDDRDSTPHHSATNNAIAVVMRFTEARLTRSSKPWMFCEIGP